MIKTYEKTAGSNYKCAECGFAVYKGAPYYMKTKKFGDGNNKFCSPSCLREHYSVYCGICGTWLKFTDRKTQTRKYCNIC